MWGPGPLWRWPVTPLPSSGPGRGTALEAKEGMGRRSACCLGSGLVSGGSGEPGRWALGTRPGPGEEGGACSRSETRERGWKVAWLSRYRARASSLLGTEARADPSSCGKQPPHACLDRPRESAFLYRWKVGPPGSRQKRGEGSGLLSLDNSTKGACMGEVRAGEMVA